MPLPPMSERFQRPDWVRRLNAMADSIAGGPDAARQLIPLDADALYEAAAQALGGGRFGDLGDPGWRERFTALVEGADRSRLTLLGRLMTKQELLRSLRVRLDLARAFDVTPALADEEIESPVVVLGPARSGTSILFELLWLDEGLRGPTAFDSMHPFPIPGFEEDVRLRATECEQELWADVQPEFAAIHELRSDLPVECVTLTSPSFCGPHWAMVLGAESAPMDVEANYRFERRLLQALQHGRPRARWLLKSPAHLFTLDGLLAEFPDVQIVQTHRDPAKTMPSTVSASAMVQWMRVDDLDIEALAQATDAVFSAALNGVAIRRASGELPASRFGDVHFQHLLREPVEAVRVAYETIGRPFEDQHAARIARYLEEKPRGKFGVHRYTPEEWGFSAEGLRQNLKPYIDHFGVALED